MSAEAIKPDTVEVESTEHFAALIAAWHSSKVKELEHFLSIPQGVEINFNDEPPVTLENDLHKGFVMGLSMALMHLGTLPFVVERDPDESQPANSDEPVKH